MIFPIPDGLRGAGRRRVRDAVVAVIVVVVVAAVVLVVVEVLLGLSLEGVVVEDEGGGAAVEKAEEVARLAMTTTRVRRNAPVVAHCLLACRRHTPRPQLQLCYYGSLHSSWRAWRRVSGAAPAATAAGPVPKTHRTRPAVTETLNVPMTDSLHLRHVQISLLTCLVQGRRGFERRLPDDDNQ